MQWLRGESVSDVTLAGVCNLCLIPTPNKDTERPQKDQCARIGAHLCRRDLSQLQADTERDQCADRHRQPHVP